MSDRPVAAGARLLFVGGAPRSGTTLVQNVLDSHPDVYGGPEFDHMPTIVGLRRLLHSSVATGRIADFVDKSDVDRHLSKLAEGLLLDKADRVGAQLLSEKTPANALVFAELLELLPAARAVHVVRDPRAVSASLLAVRRRHIDAGDALPPHLATTDSIIGHVGAHLDAAFQAARRFPTRIGTLVYEDLVADPVGITRGLCAWLGLPWNERMVKPASVVHDGEGQARRPNHWYTVERFRSEIDTCRIDGWRRELRASDLQRVIAAFANHPDLLELGYRLDDLAVARTS